MSDEEIPTKTDIYSYATVYNGPTIERVNKGEYNTIVIYDTAGERFTYRQNEGVMVWGQVIRYPWRFGPDELGTVILFVPVERFCIPILLDVIHG